MTNARLKVDFSEITGKIKPMHGVGQPPMIGLNTDYMHYIKEAHIPYSRLHDVGGPFGGAMFVDIPNIFRNFDADADDPASYDFAFTDVLIKALYDADCAPIYRLGVTIENYAKVKAYHIYPPKDYEKWASVCEHIVRHYNEGWADGFHYGIGYWEIWNEPEDGPNNEMWLGTDEEYFRLYDITAKRLKKCFGDSIKVGGYASCNLEGILQTPGKFGLDIEPQEKNYRYYFLEYAEKFFTYINEKGSPIDFFSWHSYSTLKNNRLISEGLRNLLETYGHEGLETQLNEWNNAYQTEYRGTAYAAANAAAFMLAMQDEQTDIMCYYDAAIGVFQFAGMFNPIDYTPFPLYYAFKAFGELYVLGDQVKTELNADENLFVQAAAGADNKEKAVMLANIGEDCELSLGEELGGFTEYLVDKENSLTAIGKAGKTVTVKKDQVILLKNGELHG